MNASASCGLDVGEEESRKFGWVSRNTGKLAGINSGSAADEKASPKGLHARERRGANTGKRDGGRLEITILGGRLDDE